MDSHAEVVEVVVEQEDGSQRALSENEVLDGRSDLFAQILQTKNSSPLGKCKSQNETTARDSTDHCHVVGCKTTPFRDLPC